MTTRTETILHENVEKTETKHPDFRGKLTLNSVDFRVAAWWRNNKKGEACIGLCLSIDRDSEDINLTLWVQKRQSAEDPHFKGKETVGSTAYTFLAWLQHNDEECTLRVEATPSTLSSVAMQTRSAMLAFAEEADRQFAPPHKKEITYNELNEPEDIPF